MTEPSENGKQSDSDLRQCPTPVGDVPRLITHQIQPPRCLERQREFYHKCHSCQYRGQPASFRLDPDLIRSRYE